MYTRIIAVALIYVLSTASGQALAGSVTFRAPIEVKNYPVPNATLLVWCELRSQQGQVFESNAAAFKLPGSASPAGGITQVSVHYTDEEAPNIGGYRCALVPGTGFDPQSKQPKAIPAGVKILSQVSGQFK